VDNLEIARNRVEPWRSSGVAGVDESIIDAWFRVGRKDEAISYARSLKGETLRTSALLWVARKLLDEAGAPLL